MTIEFLSRGELSTFLRTAGYSGGLISKLTNLVNSQLCDNLPNIIEGMSVSVDVSTNDHDSDHRLFGVVNDAFWKIFCDFYYDFSFSYFFYFYHQLYFSHHRVSYCYYYYYLMLFFLD